MPLQIASGKLFRSKPAFTNELRGILYTNLDLPAPLLTIAGRLVPTNNLRASTLVYEMKEHMEHHLKAGVLASRGIDPYLSDFAAVTAFGLNVICTPDPDLKRRLIIGPPAPATGVMPKRFVSTTFADRVSRNPQQARRFAEFVEHLIGLRRSVFLAAMRAIRTYITGMYRLGDDPDAAYTLLLSSPEPLLTHFDSEDPTWDNYPENRRRPIDRALRNADARTRCDVRQTLLRLDRDSVFRRFRLFVDSHLNASFFREEAAEIVRPVGRSELQRSLGHAYGLRSRYLHASKRLPRELTLGAAIGAEVTRVGRRSILTFEGLHRLARHVILQFISRQKSVAKEPYDYSTEEPGVVQVELAPEYWIHRPSNFTAKDGKKRFFAFCRQLASAKRTNGSLKITDIRGMLGQVQDRLAGMTPNDRLPFVALHCLFNAVVSPDDRIGNNSDITQVYGDELARPTIEAMVLALLTESVSEWHLDAHERALRAYFEGTGRDQGFRMDNLLEVGVILELAERYRENGDTDKATDLIRFAVENDPGNQSLIRFEQEFDASKRIRWQEVMGLRTDHGSDDG